MEDPKFFELCAKRLSRSISAEEEALLSNHLDNHPDEAKAYQQFEHQWNTSGRLKLKYEENPELAWKRFSERKADRSTKTVKWVHFATRLAAMVVLTIGLGFLFREFGKSEPYHYATIQGETKWVVLPDSSRIRLNESTLLTVASDFNAEERNVVLKGEAFFEIAKDESRPFTIQSQQATTQVLGTSFNIRALEKEEKVEIFVASGKVSFSANGTELILTQGMAADYQKAHKLLAKNAKNSNSMAWHSAVLKFNDTNLSQVFADLQNYFNVEIKVGNTSINNCRFTGEFKEPVLEEILKVISISSNISYTKNNGSYTIEGEGCSSAK